MAYVTPKLDFVRFPFALLHQMVFRKCAKFALDSRNDDQSPIDKLISGRQYKNPAKNICGSTYYSEKKVKYVAIFFGRDIFLRLSEEVCPTGHMSLSVIEKLAKRQGRVW
jgi:hypothetical protein